MPETLLTVGDVLDQAVASLRDAGVDAPQRVARRLWGDHEATQRIDPVLGRANPVDRAEGERFAALVARVAAGEPIQHVAGSVGFRRLVLGCDRRALIPRPETEGLVEAALARVCTGRVADVGTGTGAIALSLRDEGQFDDVIGIDVSADALDLARSNGARTGLAVRWLQGDLLAPLDGEVLDLLISNPPYLAEHEMTELDPSVRDHEPVLALVSGADGLAATRRLLTEGRLHVREGGWIALEIDTRRADQTAQLAAASGWTDVEVQDDLFGRARFLLARREMQQ